MSRVDAFEVDSKEVVDPASPIHGRHKADVKEAIAELKAAGNFATVQDYLPITVMDFSPIVREILKLVVQNTLDPANISTKHFHSFVVDQNCLVTAWSYLVDIIL